MIDPYKMTREKLLKADQQEKRTQVRGGFWDLTEEMLKTVPDNDKARVREEMMTAIDRIT